MEKNVPTDKLRKLAFELVMQLPPEERKKLMDHFALGSAPRRSEKRVS